MNDLVQFAKRVKMELEGAGREPFWTGDDAERYMAEVATRRELFTALAARWSQTIVLPRLETVASYFANAALGRQTSDDRCRLRFGYIERFPANAEVSVAVEHDLRYDQVLVAYDAFMVPQFIKFNEHDKLILPLAAPQEDAVIDWVEQRLLDFLVAYLQIDRGQDNFADEPVVDPVCGMRIHRSASAGSECYQGHAYFFCSEDCRSQFSQRPTLFVKIKPF